MTGVWPTDNTFKKIYHYISWKLDTIYRPRPFTMFCKQYFSYGKCLPHGIIGVEIGTENGYNARLILKNMPMISNIYLIDPFEDYKIDGKVHSCGKENEDRAHKLLSKWDHKITYMKLYSHDAVKFIQDSLHFVYIDGNHSYEDVKRDINDYWPLLKEHGIIGGHDYTPSFPGVAKAVLEFVNNHGLKLRGSDYDWWVIKDG